MEKQHLYLLYFFRVSILMLVAWLFVAMFSPAVNSKEQVLQDVVKEKQVQVNRALSQNNKRQIQGFEDVSHKFREGWKLYQDYKKLEIPCNLALDTILNLSNQTLSNRVYTQKIEALRENLNQQLSELLKKLAATNPIITQNEVKNIRDNLPKFQYSIQSNNQSLIEALNLGQIHLIKMDLANFYLSKIGCGLVYSKPFQPIPLHSVFRTDKSISIQLVLAKTESDLLFLDSISVNQKHLFPRDDIAKYNTIFKNTTIKNLNVECYLRFPFTGKTMTLNDTFQITPNQKH